MNQSAFDFLVETMGDIIDHMKVPDHVGIMWRYPAELGFGGVEVSEDSLDLQPGDRIASIKCAARTSARLYFRRLKCSK